MKWQRKEEQFCVQDDRSCLFQKSHAECAADHRQLAEWLTELKELEAKHWDECRQIAHYDDELKEAKRLLKVAMGDMEILYEAGKDEGCVGIKFKWRYADEAKKLLGGSENG